MVREYGVGANIYGKDIGKLSQSIQNPLATMLKALASVGIITT
jgi:hypothetical protein